MGNFFLIIASLWVSVSNTFSRMKRMEERGIKQTDFSMLRLHNTPMDRFLLYMLDSYKYRHVRSSHITKKERNFYYYSKKIYKYLLLLSIPWLMSIYFMKWYLIRDFVIWVTVAILVVGHLPLILLIVIQTICDCRLKRYAIEKHIKPKK